LYLRSGDNTQWIKLGKLDTPTVLVGENIDGSALQDGSIPIFKLMNGLPGQIVGMKDGVAAWIDPTTTKALKFPEQTYFPPLTTMFYITTSGDVVTFGQYTDVISANGYFSRSDGSLATGSSINPSYMLFDSDSIQSIVKVIPSEKQVFAINAVGELWQNNLRTTNFPLMSKVPDIEDVVNVYVGGQSASTINYFVQTEDTIYVKGANYAGSLGNSTTIAVSSFTALDFYVDYIQNIVSTGKTTYLHTNYDLYACGETYTTEFVLVHTFAAPIKKFCFSYTGGEFVLLTNGELWCKGTNTNGSFGLGNTNNTTEFTLLTGYTWNDIEVFNANTQVSVIGIASTGKVYAWGGNTYYQLADKSSTQRSAPVPCYKQMLDGTIEEINNGAFLSSSRFSIPYSSYYFYSTIIVTTDNEFLNNDYTSGELFTYDHLVGLTANETIADIRTYIHVAPIQSNYNFYIRSFVLTTGGKIYVKGSSVGNSLGTGNASTTTIVKLTRIDTID
jgi:alpha-tubulin suppressor-like RCC1 family protein